MQLTSKISMILMSFLLTNAVFAFDYDSRHTLMCSSISNVSNKLEQNLPQLWNILILHVIDKIVFLAGCPVVLFAQIMVLVTYGKNKYLLSKPGNIFCGLVIIQMCLNLHLYANAIYRTVFTDSSPMPSSFVGFCIFTGFYSSFFSLLHFMYLIMFMFYTIFLFRFSLKKSNQKYNKESNLFWGMLHAFVITVSICLSVLLYFQEFMGLNFYGLCGFTATRRLDWNYTLPSLQILCSIIFLILGIFTFLYFRKHMPGGERFRKRKIEETKIIFMYVTGFSILDILMSVMNLLLNINCTQSQPIPELNIFITVTNVSRLIEFCFLIFLIMFNQKFRVKFKYTLKSLCQLFDRNRVDMKARSTDLTKSIDMEDVFFDERLLEMKEISNEIDLLLLSQVYTIISGVYIAYFQYFSNCYKAEKIRSIKYRENISFFIDNRSVMGYQTDDRLLVKLKILSCTITIHCPEIFRSLIFKQGLVDIFQSFKIVDNSAKLSNLAQGKGGKSGQFFFFSSDNRYVIKTITVEQFQFYRQNLETFNQYYEQNPNSLLAKILGLLTIKGDQMQRTYRLILMKNILGCNKSQIVRLYDLKGSKHDRQVLFQQVENNQVSKMTLKDIDFINYEKNLKINSKYCQFLRQSLLKDSKFLRSLNLLDYSLLIVKVRWDKPPAEPNFWSRLQRIPHQTCQNEYYHIGVIDYMQKWDFQKRSEKWWKNFMGKKDVSAEQPNKYQIRFMQFVDEITSYFIKSKSKENEELQEDIKPVEMMQLKEVRAVTDPRKDMIIEQSLKADNQTQERNNTNGI